MGNFCPWASIIYVSSQNGQEVNLQNHDDDHSNSISYPLLSTWQYVTCFTSITPKLLRAQVFSLRIKDFEFQIQSYQIIFLWRTPQKITTKNKAMLHSLQFLVIIVTMADIDCMRTMHQAVTTLRTFHGCGAQDTPWNQCYCYCQVTDEEPEAQRGEVTSLKVCKQLMAKPDSNSAITASEQELLITLSQN